MLYEGGEVLVYAQWYINRACQMDLHVHSSTCVQDRMEGKGGQGVGGQI